MTRAGRVFGVFLTVALWAVPAAAAVEQVRVHVQGLACPFCVFGIEKNLKRIPGVESLRTTIRTGLVQMEMSQEALLEPARFREAVKRSGFSLDFIEATVTGRLVEQDGRLALRVEPSRQVLLLVEEDAQEDTMRLLTDETQRKLRAASEDGEHPLRISGRVHGHTASPPALAVEKVEVAK